MGESQTEINPIPNTLKQAKQTEQGLASAQMSARWWTDPFLNTDVGKLEPPNKAPGLVAYADGTNWNPGSGEGWYGYNAAGSWVKLG